MGSSTTSLEVGAVAVTSLVLVMVFLIASWLTGWYQVLVRRALAAARHGARLRPGLGTVHGTAQPLGGRADKLLVKSMLVVQMGVDDGSSQDARWCIIEGTPIALVTSAGEAIEIDPQEVTFSGLEWDGQSTVVSSHDDLKTRLRIEISLFTGDEIWATGVLSRAAEQGGGAYRRSVSQRRLTAPRGGRIEITRESPVRRWQALAAAHQRAAYLAAGTGVVAHLTAFASIDVALFRSGQAWSQTVLDKSPFPNPHGLPPSAVWGTIVAVPLIAVCWRHFINAARQGTGAPGRARARGPAVETSGRASSRGTPPPP